MVSLNRITIIGLLTNNPELRYSQTGDAIAYFGVACGEKHFVDEQVKESVEYFNCVCFKNIAENSAKYLKKGSKVYVEGKQRTRTWNDNNGVKHSKPELMANRVIFLDDNRPIQNGNGVKDEEPPAEDIPF